jgi:DNA-binding transcriptional ArsR family regulator
MTGQEDPADQGTDQGGALVEMMRLIGHPVRLHLLTMLAQGERPVGDLVAGTEQSASLVSQQLALLRKGGLVHARREAKQVFYALAPGKLADVARALTALDGAGEAPFSGAHPSAHVGAAVFARVAPRG